MIKRKRIAFVVHRYGEGISGGAEYQCRLLAEQLASYYEVEVLTSCANKYPWNNAYITGESNCNGVRVRRFQVEEYPCNAEEEKDLEDSAGWRVICELGPYCPTLADYLRSRYERYNTLIVYSYQHYTSMVALAHKIPHVIVVPTGHDEPRLYRPIYRELFQRASAVIYQTNEERELIERVAPTGNIPAITGCMGIHTEGISNVAIKESSSVTVGSPYIIYVGRVGFTKNFQQLNRFFIEYKKKRDTDLKLVVIGQINIGFEILYHEDIIYLGFVSEEEKLAYIRNAKLLVLPSVNESLSIVLLESMALKVPVLVNAKCAVTRAQCIRGDAGLYYENYAEFEAMTDYLLSHPDICRELGENGRRFVEENYKWETVTKNIISLIEKVCEYGE